jgi:hypothetical protein
MTPTIFARRFWRSGEQLRVRLQAAALGCMQELTSRDSSSKGGADRSGSATGSGSPRMRGACGDNDGPSVHPGGFFVGFAMRGKLRTGRFKSTLLGATDFVGREN